MQKNTSGNMYSTPFSGQKNCLEWGAFLMAKYSVQFKQDVVTYYYKNGLSATMKKFNLNYNSILYNWVRKSETVGFMRKNNKTYTNEDKLDILNYFWKNGYAETERRYDVNRSVINNWERLFREYGIEGLTYDGRGRKPNHLGPKKNVNQDEDLLAENQRLRMELLYLKKLDALVQEREERESKKKSK